MAKVPWPHQENDAGNRSNYLFTVILLVPTRGSLYLCLRIWRRNSQKKWPRPTCLFEGRPQGASSWVVYIRQRRGPQHSRAQTACLRATRHPAPPQFKAHHHQRLVPMNDSLNPICREPYRTRPPSTEMRQPDTGPESQVTFPEVLRFLLTSMWKKPGWNNDLQDNVTALKFYAVVTGMIK